LAAEINRFIREPNVQVYDLAEMCAADLFWDDGLLSELAESLCCSPLDAKKQKSFALAIVENLVESRDPHGDSGLDLFLEKAVRLSRTPFYPFSTVETGHRKKRGKILRFSKYVLIVMSFRWEKQINVSLKSLSIFLRIVREC
jgi:hypothetical protein